MTYRQAIQQMGEQLSTMYENTGWLRDQATTSEQQSFNELRAILSNAIITINKLDNRLTDGRAQTDLGIDKL
jgi:uncharacterized protein involved in exopolysaccharide biosynthesis